MKQVFALALGLVLVASAQAHGRRGGCGGCGDCGGAVAVAYTCAPAVSTPAEIKYEERKVVRHKVEMKEKEIEEVVVRCVPTEEKFTYKVQVPVMTQQKRVENILVPSQKQVEYTYQVQIPRMVQEKRVQTIMVPQQSEVEYKYTVMVPNMTQEKRLQNFTRIDRQVVEATVPVCRVVRTPCVDACGNCSGYTCQTVTEMVKTTRTVCVPVTEQREVVVNVCNYTPVEKVGKKMICNYVPQQQEVVVNVCKYDTEVRKGVKTVCEMVQQQREVVVNVCSYNTEERTGTRTVMNRVEEKVKRKVTYCETVAYETVEKVAVGGPTFVTTSCDNGCGYVSYCDNGCGGGKFRLFGRRGCR